MRSQSDIAVAAIQQRQFGLVTTGQARASGLSYHALRRRVACGALLVVHPGVFADPAVEVTFEQRALAAVLASGEHAFASHETAAQLWGLPLPRGASIEITTILERSPAVAGVRRHRSGLLRESDRTTLRNIAVATPERTVVDLSTRLSMPALSRLVDQAVHRRLTTLIRIHATLARLPAAPGRSPKTVHEILARRLPDADVRESCLEDFVFAALHRYGLPLPVCQHPVWHNGSARRIDCCYPEKMLALEAQGFAWHGGRAQFDADALRGNELQLAGWRVLMFTSAFTDRTIAEHVAAALGCAISCSPGPPLTFAAWRERLVSQGVTATTGAPNGR